MRALLAGSVVLIGVAASGFSGCASDEDVFAVKLLNDTPGTLVANQCGNGCGSSPTETDKLNPRQSVLVNTTSSHVDNWWRITSQTGRVVGCLDLLYDHKEPHVVVRLTHLTACPQS
jgi:hypothetical protein